MDDELLRYKFLNNWDRAMNTTEEKYKWLNCNDSGWVSWKHEADKVIAFERGGCLFVFNFHPTQSFVDYRVGVNQPGKYKVVLDSDDADFGGQSRIDHKVEHFTQDYSFAGRANSIQVYIPSRVCIVLALFD